MTSNFSKDIVKDYSLGNFEQVRQGMLYQVIDKEEEKGLFLISDKGSFLKYGNEALIVDSKGNEIIELNTSSRIGHFNFSTWTIFQGYQDKMMLKGKKYLFKKVKPDITYSLFNKSTWGHFKFELTSDDEIITYSFKIDIPSISLGNTLPTKPFNGIIDYVNSDLSTAILGLYLVERALDNETVESG